MALAKLPFSLMWFRVYSQIEYENKQATAVSRNDFRLYIGGAQDTEVCGCLSAPPTPLRT